MSLEHVFDAAFIEKLPKHTKIWIARALAGMVVADGVVDKSEMDALKEAIGFLDDPEEIDNLLEIVKSRKVPKLDVIKGQREPAARILMHLARIAAMDDKLTPSEANFFIHAGTKLGFNEQFSKEILEWARKLIAIKKEETKLLKLASNLPPEYKTYS